tara:strand:- start:36346 stop:36954 length:609 start_codon:yes stop_codon:yes gene_type:complete
MKTLIILISTFYLGTIFSIAQTKVFEQPYYSIIKNKTIKFEQLKDTLYVTNCNGFEKCDTLYKTIFLIESDSIIDNVTRKIVLISQDFEELSEEIREKEIILIDYKNGRKAIEENYKHRGNKNNQLAILYPKSELIKLKPISQITKIESKEILLEFTEYIKSIDKEKFDFDDFINWEKFNDLVIKRGYNPINAENKIGVKSQ